MQTPREMATDIVAREGGYVDDPSDPGGPTKYGVTIYTLRNIPWGDLDHDGDIDKRDVMALTKEHAVTIFLERYFYGPRINELPEDMQPGTFDFYVHSETNAIKLLQRTLNTRFDCHLTEDGYLGPRTLQAVAAARAQDYRLPALYATDRRDWLFRIADHRPASRKYCVTRSGDKGGWITRAEKFMPPEWRLDKAAFKRRIANWT